MSISLNPLQEIGVGKHAGRAATTGSGLNPLQEIGVGKLAKIATRKAANSLNPLQEIGVGKHRRTGRKKRL